MQVSERHRGLRRGRHGRRDAPGLCGVASGRCWRRGSSIAGRIPSGPMKQTRPCGLVIPMGVCAYAHRVSLRTDVYVGV